MSSKHTKSGKASLAPLSKKLGQSDHELRTAFKALSSPSDVADLLEIPLKTLQFYLHKKQNYQIFLIPKASGDFRGISAPVTPLKIIQRKLAQVLTAVYGSRSVVHGFAKGRSIRSNAARHLGAEWILNFDLQDFFPSVHFGRVLGLFGGKPYNLDQTVALTLARICCHAGSLPIGAPTSPIVANLVCAKMDSEFKTLAWSCGCVYTRYADDISISTKAIALDSRIAGKDLAHRQWQLGREVVDIVERNDFKINPAKTRVRGRQSSLEVTGIRINSRLNVKKELYRQVRAMLHAWEKFGESRSQETYLAKYRQKQGVHATPAFRDVVRGKIEFIGFVRGRDDRIYVTLLQRLQKLAGLHAKPIIIGPSTHESVIRQGIWLLRDHIDHHQGTAFAMNGNRLITAAHNTDHQLWACRPGYDDSVEYEVEVLQRDDELDIAEISIPRFLPVQFAFASSSEYSLKMPVCVLGFPNYHEKDSVAFRFGRIVQERTYKVGSYSNPVAVQHYVVDADIVKGNSGGPVLDNGNRVIGIAVKGLDVPGAVHDDDQLSSFVPFSCLSLPPEIPST
jgi:RNA-directed DNA polymerase